MTGTLLFLVVGSFLLVVLYVYVRRSGSSDNKIAGPAQAYQALKTLQLELLPDWFVDRLFSGEDWEFARSQRVPEVLRLLDAERKSVALSWLRQTRDYVTKLMDYHVTLSRQRPDLKPSTEIGLTMEYMRFQVVCRLLAAMIRVLGPAHVRALAERAAGMATHLGDVSETLLARLDDVAPVNATQN